jgi:hypothetical protein
MMQQQPTTPGEAPQSPSVEPGAPATATIVTEGAVISVPSTPQQLRGLRERREILRDQLERAGNRREELVSRINETGNPEARAGLHERLTVLDERIVQLERDQAATEQLISNAPPEVLAMAAREPRPSQGGMDDADGIALWFFGLTIGILITMVVGRWRRRRQRGRGDSVPTTNDPRIERLNQAVDAIAEEVERIGEGQRFVTQLLAERRAPELHERRPESR